MAEKKPNVNSAGEMELEKVKAQGDHFENQVKEMTLDRMNQAPKLEKEEQTKLSQVELSNKKDIYLKPRRQLSPGRNEKFNEKFRDDYNFQKEYVNFIAENNELIGETIEMWTKPFPGMNTEEWAIPTNKPIWAPRYVAEQIKRKSYHRLSMKGHEYTGDSIGSDELGTQYYGTMAVDNTIQRLDARPVSSRKSLFMGAASF
jgi:hypothetical protein